MSTRYNSTFRATETRLKRGKPMKKSGRLKRAGPRTSNWLRAWRWLKPRLEASGRNSCEFSFIEHECFGALDPCHSKKRRLMQGPDIFAVAIGCRNVHRILDEVFSHEQMEVAVMRAIEEHGGLILPERY